MTKTSKQINILIQGREPFSSSEASKVGISAQMLAHFCKQGRIKRLCHGVYSPLETEIFPYPEIQILAKKNTDFVVCLLSALQIHEFTTQLPNSLWIAIRQGARLPKIDGSPLTCFRLTETAYNYGIEERDLYGVKVRVYSAAKTVADCFKFRNKIGLDVAIEALKEGYRLKLFTASELWQAAKACRVSEVIRPYEEIMLS